MGAPSCTTYPLHEGLLSQRQCNWVMTPECILKVNQVELSKHHLTDCTLLMHNFNTITLQAF